MSETTPQPMFNEEFERTLDSGLRVVLPKQWREQGVTEFILASDSTNSYLKVLPKQEYVKLLMANVDANPNLNERQKQTQYEIIASSVRGAKIDNQHRLSLDEKLCTAIGIAADATVTLKGAFKTFNIWNQAKLAAHEQQLEQQALAGVPMIDVKQLLGI